MSVIWFRRDLRLHDHPALLAAAADGPVTALFVLDEALLRPSGVGRGSRSCTAACARWTPTCARTAAGWCVRRGDPAEVVPAVAREAGAGAVHVSADFAPYGAARDERVGHRAGRRRRWCAPARPTPSRPAGSTKADGSPYQVFSAVLPGLARARLAGAGRAPTRPRSTGRTDRASIPIPADPRAAGRAGAARGRRGRGPRGLGRGSARARLAGYPDERDRPDLDRTSRLSPYLHFGALHPRTLLAELTAARRDVPQGAGLARVLRGRAALLARASARTVFNPKMRQPPDPRRRRSAASRPGRTGAPATRSSTPACASCWPRAGCTTGCG